MGCVPIFFGLIVAFSVVMAWLINKMPEAEVAIYIGGIICFTVVYLFLFAGRGSQNGSDISSEQSEDDPYN